MIRSRTLKHSRFPRLGRDFTHNTGPSRRGRRDHVRASRRTSKSPVSQDARDGERAPNTYRRLAHVEALRIWERSLPSLKSRVRLQPPSRPGTRSSPTQVSRAHLAPKNVIMVTNDNYIPTGVYPSVMRYKMVKATAGVLCLLLAGCSASSTQGQGPKQDGESLQIVLPSEPSTLNPMFGVTADSIVGTAMVEPFVKLDENLAPSRDGLATDWTRVSDTVWQFAVRDGVYFHDGSPLTADAVAKSLAIQQSEPGPLAAFLKAFKGVALDAHTLQITSAQPTNATPASLASLFVVSPARYAAEGKAAFGRAPVGTGPYIFEDWASGRTVSVTKNNKYWAGKVTAARIQWSFAPDPDTRLNLLTAGQVDVAADLPTTDAARLTSGYRMENYPTTGIMKIQMNKEAPPLNDARLRKAIAQAIDREAIVKTIFGGTGAAPFQLYFNEEFGIGSSVRALDHDVDGARALLSEVGSKELSLRFPVDCTPRTSRLGKQWLGCSRRWDSRLSAFQWMGRRSSRRRTRMLGMAPSCTSRGSSSPTRPCMWVPTSYQPRHRITARTLGIRN